MPNRDNIIKHLTESHTSPEDAGGIAARAGVQTLVLSHLVPGDSEIPEDKWEARAGAEFDGTVICGVDLDQFALSP
jgi:ribonuclease BN (tRNA processing enzyme)